MKKIFILWKLIFIPFMAFCQPNKSKVDSVLLRNDTLYQWINGVRSVRGVVLPSPVGGGSVIEYFPQSQSYWSTTSGQAANKNAGFYNTIIGTGAGDSCIACYYNTFIGKNVAKRTKSAFDCVGIGYEPLFNNNGDNNIGIGDDALYGNVGGRDNVAISRGTIFYNKSGSMNNAIGLNAMANNYFGGENVALGAYALNFMGRGSGNTAVGTYAMELNELEKDSVTNIVNSTAIGYMAGFNSHYSNFVCIGAKTNVTANGDININNKIRWRNNSFEIAGSNVTIGGYTYHVTNTPPAGVQSQLIADGNGNVTWTPLGQTVRVNVQVEKPKAVYDLAGRLIGYTQPMK